MTSAGETDLESALFPSGTDFDESDRRLLFEQYRMFVETSERLVARRQTVNAFFLSINTLLLSAIGFIFQPAFGGDGWTGLSPRCWVCALRASSRLTLGGEWSHHSGS